MNVPKVDIKQLLEAGVHLGHKTLRWNPKMKQFIFGEKNSIHIIDLTQTVDFIKSALIQVHKVISSGGKLLVVSTKKQASEQVSDLAKETGQYYVNYRWLGGMLTNWNTIQNSIKRLKKLDDQLSKENLGFTKKEILKFGKENIKQHPAKSKIPFAYWMLDNLTTNTVIIIDADVGIVNSDIDIKTFFSNEDIQIQKTKYVEGYEIMQSSIIFLRKSKNIMEMLKYVWYDSIATVRRYPGMNKIDFGEQSSLQIAIECGYFDITYKELSPHICCLNTSKCTDDYLFVHFTGSRYTDKLADIHYNFKKNRKR